MATPRSFHCFIVHAGLVENDLAARRLELERHMDVAVEGSQNSRLLLRWHEEQQEAATTGAGQLAAERTGRPGLFVQSINLRIGNNAAETALGLPSFVKQFAETGDVRCACQEVEAFIDQIFHDAQLS